MDKEKIRRFLEGVNTGLQTSSRRIDAEREYLAKLQQHLPRLREILRQLRHGQSPGQPPRQITPIQRSEDLPPP